MSVASLAGISAFDYPVGFPTTTVFTFSDLSLGKNVGNRDLLIATIAIQNDSGRTIDSLEVDGEPATQVLALEGTGTIRWYLALHRILAAAGLTSETGDVVVTYTGNIYDVGCVVIPAYGLGALLDTATDTAFTGTDLGLNLDVAEDGLVVALAALWRTVGAGGTWAFNVGNGNHGAFNGDDRAQALAMHHPAAAATPMTLTATSNSAANLGSLAAIAASFSPAENGLGSGGGLLLGANKRGGMQ